MSEFKILTLPQFSDERGTLVVLEKLLPFEVNRVYWIVGKNSKLRGGHRHRITRQALITVSGVVSILMDDGNSQEEIILDSSNKCLIVEPEDWHAMSFQENSVLLVLASHVYDPNDYIFERIGELS